MKITFSILLIALCGIASAQSVEDSIEIRQNKFIGKVDPLQDKALPDSITYSLQVADSIRENFNQETLVIKEQYDKSMSAIDDESKKIKSKMDSLGKLNLPTKQYTGKLDSLKQHKKSVTTEFNSKVQSLKSKTTGKLNSLDLPPEYREPVQQLTSKVDDFGLNSDFVKIPQLDIPGYQLPKLDGIGDIGKISDVGDLGKLGTDLNLPKIETPVGDIGQITDQLKNVSGDVTNIASGNLSEVKELPKTLEQQAMKIDGVQELQKQSGVIDEYEDKFDAVKDPKKGKELAIEKVKEIAVDHFAGKEEQLKRAMDQMAKYKQKYSSVSSLKDLPKRPPNAMKGKPFIERLLPGFYFQYQQKRYNLFDFNPYVGYHISGRFTFGIGWNQRFAWDPDRNEWNKDARIFGPRAFVDFKLGKGFIAHLEGETMDTFVPSTIFGNPDYGHREWVWGMMTGMKKQYKVYKNLRGTVVLQYNVFNPKFKAPYVDRINSRIGFEYVLRKKPTAKNG